MLLHALLSMPVDSAGLAGALRALSHRQVDHLLAYLAAWVDKYHSALGAATGAVVLPPALLFPTYAQVGGCPHDAASRAGDARGEMRGPAAKEGAC